MTWSRSILRDLCCTRCSDLYGFLKRLVDGQGVFVRMCSCALGGVEEIVMWKARDKVVQLCC